MPAGRTIPFISSVKIDNEHNLELRTDLENKTAEVVNLVTGETWTGGEGGALTFEEGYWTPESDMDNADIAFSNPHETPPFYFAIICVDGGSVSIVGVYELSFLNIYAYTGAIISGGTSPSLHYGLVTPRRRTAVNSGLSGSSIVLSSEADLANYATNEKIIAPSGANNTPYSSQLTYKWFAVWNS